MWSVLRSIWVVFIHLFRPIYTVQYPDVKRRLPPRWRGRIILTRDPRGEERCVACNLCSVACPPSCISLQAATRADGRRYPEFFRINFSRCIFCGFCEEACPTRAIQLTPDYEMGEFERKNLVYEKEDLLVDGQGKYPGYDFYEQAGVKPAEAGKEAPAGTTVPGAKAGGRAKVDPRSLLP
jgi:NADH-quinone oxidoreductase subunit I